MDFNFHAPIGVLVRESKASDFSGLRRTRRQVVCHFIQCDTKYLPPSLYGFLTRLQKGHNFFWSPSREKTGGRGGEEEENIAKQSDHVLKP